MIVSVTQGIILCASLQFSQVGSTYTVGAFITGLSDYILRYEGTITVGEWTWPLAGLKTEFP